MDDAVLAKLRDIAARYGPGVCEDARRVEAVLRDLSGEHRREIAVLVAAVREGVPAEMLALGNQALPSVTRERLVRLLVDHQGLAAVAARWSVDTWASALGVAPPVMADRNQQATRATASSGPVDAQVRTARIARLVSSATEIATSIRDKSSAASALASLATVLVHTDDDRATQYLDEAVGHVQSMTNESMKARELHDLATTLSATHPDRAEPLAQSIPFEGPVKDDALGCLARALIGTDPDRALRLAWSITHQGLQAYELEGLAIALAATEPDRAERLARSLTGDYWKAEALSRLATALEKTDPGRAARFVDDAERLARALADEAGRASVLSSIGKALADTEPERAGGCSTRQSALLNHSPMRPLRHRR